MTKEDKIQEAYGSDYYEEFSRYIDAGGWIKFSDSIHFRQFNNFHGEKEISSFHTKWRPNSLSGIENNNGWTVLNKESYEELENGYYMWYNNTNGDWEIDDLSDTHIDNYTHFQKIQVPPKPPIY